MADFYLFESKNLSFHATMQNTAKPRDAPPRTVLVFSSFQSATNKLYVSYIIWLCFCYFSYYGNTGGAGYGYDNSGGFDAGYGQYPAQQPTMMVPGGNQQYSGQIMQPQVQTITICFITHRYFYPSLKLGVF